LNPHQPTTWPASLIPVALLYGPVEYGASAQVDHLLAVPQERGGPGLGVRLAGHLPGQVDRVPWLLVPPRVPRSVMAPLLYKNAW
jgi:hypothetical protein